MCFVQMIFLILWVTSESMSAHKLPLGTAPGKRNDAWIVERHLPDGVRQPFSCQLIFLLPYTSNLNCKSVAIKLNLNMKTSRVWCHGTSFTCQDWGSRLPKESNLLLQHMVQVERAMFDPSSGQYNWRGTPSLNKYPACGGSYPGVPFSGLKFTRTWSLLLIQKDIFLTL